MFSAYLIRRSPGLQGQINIGAFGAPISGKIQVFEECRDVQSLVR